MQDVEVRLEEVEREVREVRHDVSKINVDMTLLAQRQQHNAKAIDDLNANMMSNHSAQMNTMRQLSSDSKKVSTRLGFLNGVLIVSFLSTAGLVGAVNSEEKNILGILELILKFI